MTIFDLRCDRCAAPLIGLAGWRESAGASGAHEGVRFEYDPGHPAMADNSGLLCVACWSAATTALGRPGGLRCAECGVELAGQPLLRVGRHGSLDRWHLCREHAVRWLNHLRTVEPKLDLATFVLPEPEPAPALDDRAGAWVQVRLRGPEGAGGPPAKP